MVTFTHLCFKDFHHGQIYTLVSNMSIRVKIQTCFKDFHHGKSIHTCFKNVHTGKYAHLFQKCPLW